MNWNTNKSLFLSRLCTAGFALLLAGMDLGCPWLVRGYVRLRGMTDAAGSAMIVTLYLGSVFAWPLLWHLWRLLGNLKREEIFTEENVAHLRAVSWCCAGGALVCLGGTRWYLPFLVVGLAAAFMSLIVRTVKNVFNQAVAMKSELDLTI